MEELLNIFSWSYSRHNTFTTCLRQYYYQYYGSWGGWDTNSDSKIREIYTLKQMQSIPILIGSLIHNTIEKVLAGVEMGREIPIKNSKESIVKEFKRCWQDSKDKLWMDKPKWKTNLFEHFYNKIPNKEELIDIKNALESCVEGFYNSDSFKFIKTLSPKRQWLSMEKLDSINIDGVKVWVKLDFSLKHRDKIYIYDWKTGKETKQNETQLAVYALYAVEKWNIKLDKISLFDIYLRRQLPVKVKPTRSIIDSALHLISDSANNMKSLLSDTEKNIADIENFPQTEKEWPCNYCNYLKICKPEIFTKTLPHK